MDATGYHVKARTNASGPGALWHRRGLLWSLTLREVQVRYRQAFLGVVWALLQPLALMLVATLVFHRFLAVEAGGTPYPLFVFAGLVVWTFFHTAISSAVPSLVTNADLVRKIWFPREALVLAAIGAALLDLCVGLALLVLWAIAHGTSLGWAWLALPLPLLVGVAAAVGLSLLGAAINVYYRDVKHALPLLLQVLFFATPIVYRWDAVPEAWRPILLANPLTSVVTGVRAVVLEGTAPDPALLVPGAAVALLLVVVGWSVFRVAERRFADVV